MKMKRVIVAIRDSLEVVHIISSDVLTSKRDFSVKLYGCGS